MLSSAQLEHYRTEGYLVLPDFVEANEVELLRAEVERLLEAAPRQPGGRCDQRDRPVDFAADFSFAKPGGQAPVLNRLSHPLWHSEVVLRTYGHPKLLAAATALYGAELVPFAESIVLKLADSGAPFAWHQDGTFKSGPQPERGVNFGLYLHQADADNGCLFVLPRSHQNGQVDLDGLLRDGTIAAAIPVAAAPGDVIVHNRSLVHGSMANTSPRQRVTIYFGYHTVKTVESLYPAAHIERRRQVVGLGIQARRQSGLFDGETPFDYPVELPTPPTPAERQQILRAPPLAV